MAGHEGSSSVKLSECDVNAETSESCVICDLLFKSTLKYRHHMENIHNINITEVNSKSVLTSTSDQKCDQEYCTSKIVVNEKNVHDRENQLKAFNTELTSAGGDYIVPGEGSNATLLIDVSGDQSDCGWIEDRSTEGQHIPDDGDTNKQSYDAEQIRSLDKQMSTDKEDEHSLVAQRRSLVMPASNAVENINECFSSIIDKDNCSNFDAENKLQSAFGPTECCTISETSEGFTSTQDEHGTVSGNAISDFSLSVIHEESSLNKTEDSFDVLIKSTSRSCDVCHKTFQSYDQYHMHMTDAHNVLDRVGDVVYFQDVLDSLIGDTTLIGEERPTLWDLRSSEEKHTSSMSVNTNGNELLDQKSKEDAINADSLRATSTGTLKCSEPQPDAELGAVQETGNSCEAAIGSHFQSRTAPTKCPDVKAGNEKQRNSDLVIDLTDDFEENTPVAKRQRRDSSDSGISTGPHSNSRPSSICPVIPQVRSVSQTEQTDSSSHDPLGSANGANSGVQVCSDERQCVQDQAELPSNQDTGLVIKNVRTLVSGESVTPAEDQYKRDCNDIQLHIRQVMSALPLVLRYYIERLTVIHCAELLQMATCMKVSPNDVQYQYQILKRKLSSKSRNIQPLSDVTVCHLCSVPVPAEATRVHLLSKGHLGKIVQYYIRDVQSSTHRREMQTSSQVASAQPVLFADKNSSFAQRYETVSHTSASSSSTTRIPERFMGHQVPSAPASHLAPPHDIRVKCESSVQPPYRMRPCNGDLQSVYENFPPNVTIQRTTLLPNEVGPQVRYGVPAGLQICSTLKSKLNFMRR